MMKTLIIVDMQVDFVSGSLANVEAQKIIPNMKNFIKEFEGDIICTRDTHYSDYLETQEGKNLPIYHCQYGTEGWELDEDVWQAVKEKPNFIVVNKDTFGDISAICEELDPYTNEIYLCGVCTDICLISIGLNLKARFPEIKMYCIADLCAGLTPEKHAAAAVDAIVKWLTAIKKGGCKGVTLGLSGGKDSTVVAMLAVKVWGKDNVHGVIMPNTNWEDVKDAMDIARALNIHYHIASIEDAYRSIIFELGSIDAQAATNIAPRLRMTTLYAYAQTRGYRVIGTGNQSERYIGWCTKFGDMGCDMNPIAHLTCGQVVEIGLYLAEEFGLNPNLIKRPPADGLTGKTDEDNFGFTYEQLDRYILNGTSGNRDIDKKIEKMHAAALHKLTMPATMEMEGL